jgi:hypothetical protein
VKNIGHGHQPQTAPAKDTKFAKPVMPAKPGSSMNLTKPSKRRKESEVKQEEGDVEMSQIEHEHSSSGLPTRYKAGAHPSSWTKRVKLWDEEDNGLAHREERASPYFK